MKQIAWAIVVTGLTAVANGASVTLEPTSSVDCVSDGDVVTFDVLMDFSDYPFGTIGGSFDIIYDSNALQFSALFVDSGIGEPLHSDGPDILNGRLSDWTVKDFSGLPFKAVLGNVQFKVLPTMGDAGSVATAVTTGVGGPWIDAANFTDPINVDFNTVTVIRGSDGVADLDFDCVANRFDNCVLVANADQRDTNGDQFGNICDADLDNDCIVNFIDLARMKAVFFDADADADLSGDGVVNFRDLAIMKEQIFGPPGPSGPADCP